MNGRGTPSIMLSEQRGLEVQQDISQRLGQELLAAIPQGADELRFVVQIMLVSYMKSKILTYRNGEKVGSLPRAGEADRCVWDLRDAMYAPIGGTWLSAEFQVSTNGRMRASFNYDEEPVVLGVDGRPRHIGSAAFAQDFKKYPRSSESTPDWLAARVREGQTELEQMRAKDSSV